MLLPPRRAGTRDVARACMVKMIALSQGDVTGAIRAFARATELFPGVALTWYNLAVACNRGGQLSQAEDCYRRASLLTPEDADVAQSLAKVQAKQGRNHEAWLTHQRAITLAVSRGAAALEKSAEDISEGTFGDAATAGMAVKDYSAVNRLLLLCSRLRPSEPRAFIRLGHMHMMLNQHALAAQALLRAARLAAISSSCPHPARAGTTGGNESSEMGGGEDMGCDIMSDEAIAGMTSRRAEQVVEVLCSLLLSLRRSALWAVYDPDSRYPGQQTLCGHAAASQCE